MREKDYGIMQICAKLNESFSPNLDENMHDFCAPVFLRTSDRVDASGLGLKHL